MSETNRRLRMVTVAERRLSWVHVVIEAVFHRHNVSAILRSCDAMGVHHVHLVGAKAFEASAAARGANRWLDVHHHETPEAAIEVLRARGVALWVADLHPDGRPPSDVPVSGPTALWVGGEWVGVGDAAKAAATGVITLPMWGFAQSLNVSVATALMLQPIAAAARANGDPGLGADGMRELLATWVARDEEDTVSRNGRMGR